MSSTTKPCTSNEKKRKPINEEAISMMMVNLETENTRLKTENTRLKNELDEAHAYIKRLQEIYCS